MPTSKEYISKKKKARRRPGREEVSEEISEEDLSEPVASTSTSQSASESASESFSDSEETPLRKKIHIEFPYSEAVRAKVPKAFDIAENVAEEWVNDGNFENVPLGHPLAQITVAAGLRKAKEVEKKLEEKGVFMMAKMGLEYAKSKLHKK
ncbi:MAG TPA: hypothetical protein VIG33_10485 [Pseudobdellovibrionaceae bacterium]|jgi:hypothetical protein